MGFGQAGRAGLRRRHLRHGRHADRLRRRRWSGRGRPGRPSTGWTPRSWPVTTACRRPAWSASCCPRIGTQSAIDRINELEIDDVAGHRRAARCGRRAGRRLAAARNAIATSCTDAAGQGPDRGARLVAPSVLVTADEVTRGKPAPEPFLMAAERLGVDPGAAWWSRTHRPGLTAAGPPAASPWVSPRPRRSGCRPTRSCPTCPRCGSRSSRGAASASAKPERSLTATRWSLTGWILHGRRRFHTVRAKSTWVEPSRCRDQPVLRRKTRFVSTGPCGLRLSDPASRWSSPLRPFFASSASRNFRLVSSSGACLRTGLVSGHGLILTDQHHRLLSGCGSAPATATGCGGHCWPLSTARAVLAVLRLRLRLVGAGCRRASVASSPVDRDQRHRGAVRDDLAHRLGDLAAVEAQAEDGVGAGGLGHLDQPGRRRPGGTGSACSRSRPAVPPRELRRQLAGAGHHPDHVADAPRRSPGRATRPW